VLIDSHCHPSDAAFAEDPLAPLQRAFAQGVTGLVAIAAPEFARAHQAAVPGLNLWATAGIHPHDAAAATNETWAQLAADAADPLVLAIGEIGLDYHYDHSPRPTQRAVFERQLALARDVGLPVSIHCRSGASAPDSDAFADCFAALAAISPPGGVFHCFTGGAAEAARALDLGFYLSFSGMLTFPKLEPLRAIARHAPADRILIETDAPFLAPVPHRGRRNEPAFVRDTAASLAALRAVSLAELASLTAANFHRLFPRAT
jgi:TatD DNase family protein